MWRLFLLLMLSLACGGGNRQIFQSCDGPGNGASGDCADGLICEVQDQCVDSKPSCPGTCVKRCSSAADCPAGDACGPNGLSPENGGGGVVGTATVCVAQ